MLILITFFIFTHFYFILFSYKLRLISIDGVECESHRAVESITPKISLSLFNRIIFFMRWKISIANKSYASKKFKLSTLTQNICQKLSKCLYLWYFLNNTQLVQFISTATHNDPETATPSVEFQWNFQT